MQLILDGDTDIDIKRNMSTIEGESLSEKFLTNKIIEHLTDDISNGNKENIQKQDNIIPDQEEEGDVETDKEISSKHNVIETNGGNLEDNKDVPDDVASERDAAQKVENVENAEDIKDAENEDEKLENLKEKYENVEKVENEIANVEKIEFIVENVEKIDSDDSHLEPAVVEQIDKKPELNVDHETNSAIVDKLNQKESQNKHDNFPLNNDNSPDCVKELDNEYETDIIINDNDSAGKESSNDKTIEQKINNIDSKVEVEGKSEDLAQNLDHSEVPTDVENKETAMECSEEILVESDIKPEPSKTTPIEIEDEDEKAEPSPGFANVDDKQMEPQNNDVAKSPKKLEESNNEPEAPKTPPRFCKLSNNLDIFSDDEEDDSPEGDTSKNESPTVPDKQCINIDDDDDIMLIDEDLNTKENKKQDVSNVQEDTSCSNNFETTSDTPVTNDEVAKEKIEIMEPMDEVSPPKTDTTSILTKQTREEEETNKMPINKPSAPDKVREPLLPTNFIKTCKKNFADMTRNDLEEFCILKIVESIVDRSNLGEIKAQLKTLTQNMEEYKNKAKVLTKQNRDLQVVLKSIQEEQKSGSDLPITPLKITRSVGMQVLMTNEKSTVQKKKSVGFGNPASNGGSTPNNKQAKNQSNSNARNQKLQNVPIPVPRLVPANSPASKANPVSQTASIPTGKLVTSLPNGVKNSPPALKAAEKRVRVPSATVDLTDDEPPAKLSSRNNVSQGLRVLPPSNLIASQRPAFAQNMNSPRKVYIPISGPPGQTVRPGQTIMLRAVGTGPSPRRGVPPPHLTKVSSNASAVRLGRMQALRHPGPLPEALKQCQPPNWKALPPAPDIKLSKVENGIVISWKIDEFVADNYEEIASFQLYAYQESTLPPSTNLWKKIGDVKALPLPMACTLTQFMPGYKYYFAVRAVDVKTRFGPFSFPASILLLNST